jgi:hypothetical protein
MATSWAKVVLGPVKIAQPSLAEPPYLLGLTRQSTTPMALLILGAAVAVAALEHL